MQRLLWKLKNNLKEVKFRPCHLLPSLLLILTLIFFDQWTKHLAQVSFPFMSGGYPYGGLALFDLLGVKASLVFTVNYGAAWSIFSGHTAALFIVRLLLVIGLFAWFLFQDFTKWGRLFLSLILAGAVGNLIDTLSYGYVRDMIFFEFWAYRYPVFNIADIAICLGTVGLIIVSYQVERKRGQ